MTAGVTDVATALAPTAAVAAVGLPPAQTALLWALFAFVVVAAIVVARARTVLSALVAFAGYGLGLAMVWVLFRAPDVALTEAAVGAGVTTALFLVLVRRFGDLPTAPASAPEAPGPDQPTAASVGDGVRGRPASLAVAVAVAGGLLLTVPSLPAVGDPTAPAFGPVTEFYLADAADRGIDNAVTAVLVVYRGFDTFGEIAVVATAAVAVLAVFRREVAA
jgi:multicomponent Na+:H+ antiporter subunit B